MVPLGARQLLLPTLSRRILGFEVKRLNFVKV
jgi:hypothetical protein